MICQLLSLVLTPPPLPQNSSSWVLNDLAAVYWRVMGNGEMAVRCLKVALQHTPAKYRVSVRVGVRVRGVRSEDCRKVHSGQCTHQTLTAVCGGMS